MSQKTIILCVFSFVFIIDTYKVGNVYKNGGKLNKVACRRRKFCKILAKIARMARRRRKIYENGKKII